VVAAEVAATDTTTLVDVANRSTIPTTNVAGPPDQLPPQFDTPSTCSRTELHWAPTTAIGIELQTHQRLHDE
jgi:hypothetical protein